jgi:hypothetical protein
LSKKRILILGHPRSGTLYTTVVLRTLGLDVEHERQGSDGSVTTQFWYGKWNLGDYDVILHQVRNPLKVIASSTKMRIGNPKVITHLAELSGTTLTETQRRHKVKRYMATWIGFVKWADSLCAWRYRVEDMEDVFPRLCREFGIPETAALPPIPKDINTFHMHYKKLTYNKLAKLDKDMAAQVHALACVYGYEQPKDTSCGP